MGLCLNSLISVLVGKWWIEPKQLINPMQNNYEAASMASGSEEIDACFAASSGSQTRPLRCSTCITCGCSDRQIVSVALWPPNLATGAWLEWFWDFCFSGCPFPNSSTAAQSCSHQLQLVWPSAAWSLKRSLLFLRRNAPQFIANCWCKYHLTHATLLLKMATVKSSNVLT